MTMNSSSFDNSSSPRLLFLEDTNTTGCFKLSPWFMVTRGVLVLPMSVLILFLAQQQWCRRQRSATMTHTDVIAVHQAAAEIFWPFATGLHISGEFLDLDDVVTGGHFLVCMTLYGQSLFHLLGGVERYLAVMYPVTYRGLKNERGVRIRNASVGCTWLFCVTVSCFATLSLSSSVLILNLVLICLIDAAMSFLSLSVLCLLIRRGPGKKSRERADVRKQKALSTVMVILAMLWLWFAGFLVGTLLMMHKPLQCETSAYIYVFNLPCSMLLPLLYLHRTGKLKCNRK